ncbi:MAG TPA: hypothetical protein VNQ76_18645 [Planctomicrobium sp.]|nr:hypothetical protein [Planctomicrobium sp.]
MPDACRGSLLSLAVLLFCVTGCQKSEEVHRIYVNGKITLDGKPIPAGEILFEPDNTKGNRGPAGVADIKNGEFICRKGFGVVGGPHVAIISANSGQALPQDGQLPTGYVLISEHRMPIDFPKDQLKQSIEISSTDLKKRK